MGEHELPAGAGPQAGVAGDSARAGGQPAGSVTGIKAIIIVLGFRHVFAVRENEISDFPICNKSFDLSYCGNDL